MKGFSSIHPLINGGHRGIHRRNDVARARPNSSSDSPHRSAGRSNNVGRNSRNRENSRGSNKARNTHRNHRRSNSSRIDQAREPYRTTVDETWRPPERPTAAT